MQPTTTTRRALGVRIPGAGEANLRVAFQVFRLIQTVDAPQTVRAWFMGMNPQLDDVSPAEALSEGAHREVMAAARAFVAGG